MKNPNPQWKRLDTVGAVLEDIQVARRWLGPRSHALRTLAACDSAIRELAARVEAAEQKAAKLEAAGEIAQLRAYVEKLEAL